MTMRLLAATGVLVSAAVHLYLWFDGARNDDVLGPSFMLNAISGVVIAVLVLVWRHWVPAFLTVGFALSSLGALLLAGTVGFFGVQQSLSGWAVWTAILSELLAAVAGAVLLVETNPLRSRGELEDHSAVKGAHLH